MIAVGISISFSDVTNTIGAILSNEVVPPPPPIDNTRYLDGGNAFTESFSQVIDGGDAFTSIFSTDYNGNSA